MGKKKRPHRFEGQEMAFGVLPTWLEKGVLLSFGQCAKYDRLHRLGA